MLWDGPLSVSPEEQQILSLFLFALMASDVVLWSHWCLQGESAGKRHKSEPGCGDSFYPDHCLAGDLLGCLVVCASPWATSPDPSSIPAARSTARGMMWEQKLQPEGLWSNPKTVPSALEEEDCSEQREGRKYHFHLFSAKEMPRTSGWPEWKWSCTSLNRRFYLEFVLVLPQPANK